MKGERRSDVGLGVIVSFTKKLLILHVVMFFFPLILCTNLGFAATPKLHQDEVRALQEIGKRLGIGKRDWDFGMDPCSGGGNWNLPESRKGFETSVTCDCSFDHNATCHIVRIALKSQNLSAGVPPEFSNLRHLQRLDLSRNYLNGTIPPTWANMRLVELSLMGNRLSGQFPKVLTKITTLANLSIEGNRFSGSIPQEIGNLINLQKLILSSNAFTGQLPVALAKLTNLTDMRISDNNFTGKIPDFISKWTIIEKLHMQGCSLEGPIPSTISDLTSLSDLRISDLKGRGSNFPLLSNMDSLKTLILRNCLIYGEIPKYIGDMTKLKNLDLSFNNLTGEIPTSFIQLAKADFLFLTGNNLTGPIPGWILSRNKNVDLSYNRFTWESSAPNECPRGSVNLVESYSSSADKLSSVHPCLKQNFPCSASRKQHRYSLYINCGGKEININNNTKYEADLEVRGASMFYLGQNWAFSSTGNFMDDDADSDLYTHSNASTLYNVSTPELYTTARASPLSLTYYGLCLMNGNYTVHLHFAEIIFSLDSSFLSLGKRVFDIHIQGKLVLKDFDIENEAGGAGRPIVKNFTASVTSQTLKIHLYWAGRGTTGIPNRGNYGPLISAISVDPNFTPPVDGKKIEVGLVLGIVAGGLFVIVLVLGILWRKGCLGGKKSADRDISLFENFSYYNS